MSASRFLRVVGTVVAVSFLLPPVALGAILSAGDVDDNLNFDHFQQWADGAASRHGALPALNLSDRVTLKVQNETGVPVPNAQVTIRAEGQNETLAFGQAGTDGLFRFFPRHDGAGNLTKFRVEVLAPDGSGNATAANLDLEALGGDRTLTVVAEGMPTALPTMLDLMLVIDTTGSMGDELRYLTTEVRGIVENLTLDNPNVTISFAAVAYRDQGDDYVTLSLAFNGSLAEVQGWLRQQGASGGGDFPEAMELGLEAGISASWRSGNVARALVLVADAPPHDENLGAMMEHVEAARLAGIRIFPLAASGVDENAEYVMRAAALLTGGRYMFLTDDSGVGNSHALPHILCYQVTSLAHLIKRVLASELAGTRVEAAPADLIREVGNITAGVCVDEQLAGPELPLVDGETPVAPERPARTPTSTATTSDPSTDSWSSTDTSEVAYPSPATGSGSTTGDDAGPTLTASAGTYTFETSEYSRSTTPLDTSGSHEAAAVAAPASAGDVGTLLAPGPSAAGNAALPVPIYASMLEVLVLAAGLMSAMAGTRARLRLQN